jgi:ABC-type multidrug transport system permease subunit
MVPIIKIFFQTLTYLRVLVNVFVGLMLGTLYWQAGRDGTKVLDNYNLLFSILMHHMMSTMMLTILTFPNEMSILIKEHFNRWYSLKMYYASVTLIDIPVSVVCCVLFSIIIYGMTGQPYEQDRFFMFLVISMLVVFVAQSFGLMIGAVFNVVNGTFLGPTLSVPMMMFAGFGVTLNDLPTYLYWGSYISYLRYGLEGFVGAIYGLERPTIYCPDDAYCHYKYPKKFLQDIAMKGDQFGNDVIALLLILFILRVIAYVLLRYKLMAIR